MPFIGFILIAMGLFSVGGVLYMVMREPHEPQEEWYVPPSDTQAAPPPAAEPEAKAKTE